MGDLFREFQDQLEHIGRKYHDAPQNELAFLFLLALEREEIVSVAMTPGQAQNFCERLLSEDWWQSTSMSWKLLDARTPQRWGSEFSLYQNSMNPVMTGSSFRSGRLAHKSPWIQGLYLAGSSTSPGQWISFCGISGILAADLLRKDFS